MNVQAGVGVLSHGVPNLGDDMGFLSRLLAPRSIRCAMHPGAGGAASREEASVSQRRRT